MKKIILALGLWSGVATAEPLRVALTFDDSLKDHALIAAPMLEERGWRGVFNIITDKVGAGERYMTWEDVRGLLVRGHEVTTHTMSHPNLVKLIADGKADVARAELVGSVEAIRKNTGFTPVYMCSPGIAQNEATEKLCREVGLIQMSGNRYNFGEGNEEGVRPVVEERLAKGAKFLDILHHGVSAADHGGWRPFKNRETFAKHLDAIASLEKEGKVVVTDYRGMVTDCSLGRKAWPHHGKGALVLTFDDRNYDRWVKAMPLFAKYGAHASFFPDGPLDDHALGQLKKLKEAGHTVGVHTLNHGNAKEAFESGKGEEYCEKYVKPQLAAYARIGHAVRAMAYPNNAHCAASDAYLAEKAGIRHFRAGHVVRYDPEKRHPKADLVKTDAVFFPYAELRDKVVLEGIGIGESYRTDIDEIESCIRRAAARDEVLVTYSHNICPDAKTISMKTEWLERILATAASCGVEILGFDELP